MNKKSVSVLFSLLILLIAADAKPQNYGSYQSTMVRQQQQTPYGMTEVVEQRRTVQNNGYGGRSTTVVRQTNTGPAYGNGYSNGYGKK